MASRWLRRILLTAAMAFLSLTISSPAWAATDEVDLHQENVTADDPEFDSTDGDCEEDTGPGGALEGIEEGQDGWHFLLPDSAGNAFVSITLNFTDNGGDPVVVEIDTALPNPDTGTGWEGFIGDPTDKHAWLITEAGWTLVDGTAEVDVSGNETQTSFNLSHSCPGTPDDEEPPCVEDCETPTPTLSASPSTSPTDPGLPTTGTSITGLVATGLVLVGAGVGLMLLRRRRGITDAGNDS